MTYVSKLMTSLTAGMFLVAGQSLTAADPSAKLSSQDRKFMMDAATGGMMEVQMGHMGQEKGSSQGVKSFSQRLIDDHTKANNELKTLAQQKGVTLPPDNPSTISKKLSSKTGIAFDQEFARMAVADHQKDIAAFEKEASFGSDPDVKAWAIAALPTLRGHLDTAKALDSSSK